MLVNMLCGKKTRLAIKFSNQLDFFTPFVSDDTVSCLRCRKIKVNLLSKKYE